ncbi:MAG: hypothetical protein LC725_06200 [Lentisphaerae bacterium]|nr:hypothetical protein [Lentisphaerota bacterium]
MIVKMQKVSVVCLADDCGRTLDALRELGVLHLVHERPPEGEALERAQTRLKDVRRVQEALSAVTPADEPAAAAPPEKLVEQVLDLLRQRQELAERMAELRTECLRVEPFGSFDPRELARLSDAGVQVGLYQLPAGSPLPEVGEAVLQVLRSDKRGIYFVVVSRTPVEVAAQAVRPPESSLADLRERLTATESESAELEDELVRMAALRDRLKDLADRLEDEAAYAAAQAGMGKHDALVYLRGYAPVESADVLRRAAQQNGWAILLEQPAEDEPVPTLLRNPAWVRPIKAVFEMIGILPGYREVDISAAFLLFLSLFFAMLIGDAGYGLLFLGLTWLARRKFPRAPVYYFRLLQIMSVCTVVWGALNGVYFGMQPAGLSFITVPWLAEEHNVMLLCFFIGATHLTVAHLWNVARMWNTPRVLAQVGWICTTWTMLFAARTMVLGAPFPSFMFGVLAAGVALIVLFMTPPRMLKHEWFNHVMLPLNLVGNFVDVVSYLRLFAVGAASLAVASSFNTMALDLGAGVAPGVLRVLLGLAAALILFFGHALNILLCAMGVLVHGVRLNTLEFSSHVGLQWSGQNYRPFARRAPAGAVAPVCAVED